MTRFSKDAYLSGDQVDEGGHSAFIQKVRAVTSAGADAALATAAKQDTGNTSLSSIDGKVATAAKQPALGTAAAPSTDVITVNGPSATGTATASAGNPFPISGLYSTASGQATKTVGSVYTLETNKNGNLKTVVSGFSTAPYDTNNVVLMPMSSLSNSENVATIGPLGVLPFVNNGSANFYPRGDSGGAVVQEGAIASSRWSYAAAASGISNTTTAVTFIAAAGAGVRNYCSGIQIFSDALGAATEIAIRDGAAGTVLWRGKIGTGGLTGGEAIIFDMPLKGTANTLMEFVTLTASITGAVYFNAQGFQGA